MDLRFLNKICFTICIVCIVSGLVLGISLIWVSSGNEDLWKGLLTIGLLFVAAAQTMAVSNAFQGRVAVMID